MALPVDDDTREEAAGLRAGGRPVVERVLPVEDRLLQRARQRTRGVPYSPPATGMKASFLSALILFTSACSASPDGGATKTRQQAAPRVSSPPPASGATPAAPGTRVPDPVLRACDLVAQIAARSKGVTITRSIGPLDNERERRTRSGCSVSLVVSTAALGASPNPIERLRGQFAARGWQEVIVPDQRYKAGVARERC